MTRRIFGPFNRVEGDLEVQVEIADGAVSAAWVNSPLYRGFEQILHGKDPRDALVYTPRICGICSVSQSMAAAAALRAAMGVTEADNGALAANLVLACENLCDHLTHFYLFFMPDFARAEYADRPDFPATTARFKAQTGTASRDMLPARAAFLHLTGILAGKWPHSLALQPGGTTRAIEPQEKAQLRTIVALFRRFLETTLFADRLEQVSALDSAATLHTWARAHPQGDFAHFLRLSDALRLDQLGRGGGRFLSYGAYALQGSHLLARGTWDGASKPLDTNAITEDISHAWLHGQTGPMHPLHGCTLTSLDNPDAYTWCKAPRLDGAVMETGALARQMVDGNPLARDLAFKGSNVQARVVARLLELARVVPAMEQWVATLQPGAPFCNAAEMPDEADGTGLVEAARGSLGHWLRIRKGRILNYQIIAPTTWNFSPRDTAGTPGALEQALVGTPVGADGADSAAVQHVVRSFDPCMVCTVH
ncbi:MULTISPECIES: nickel-dependent hydrogenase large subunit [unclassified Thiomonas]|uniref:nickel-dependent hydrogenase large subunit n=1 Tax=unclassified Thiomonas TaxID=2625466 RepID=UPI0004DBC918|nr:MULTISPECIES: nickel-dependent hydrogenase large subunit [unclassified Thiomonas]CQR43059.1 putative ferredoxin hydrogenase, large subunit [Thiomonas sp. CB3]CDW93709.1 Nickel-dependent hydrogenase large subunit hupV [Thiomonas sp. CB2]VDY04884.1 Nickel-dependent hydrogenase large subunit [Thiomonas sp. Bio17B3]VDY07946.1 Nickel-dependent hydrogenase large subunit [Thiomonas sp. Sup16B3]VDY13136.1 putative ferredoxin hydrogenase, large subunit [Thiomonas sp. OC7]